MTLIVSWVAMDDKKGGKKTASLYLASDSRISWSDGNKEDNKQKIFISRKQPEMFALCGDYTHGSKILKDLIEKIDNDCICMKDRPINDKVFELENYFNNNKDRKKLICESIFLYGTKVGKDFFLYKFIINHNNVKAENVSLGNKSQIRSPDGSGRNEFKDNWLNFYENAQAFNEDDTSRGSFRCIYEAIDNATDPYVGGKMQAAVLYRGYDVPHPIGIYYGDNCYVFGDKLAPSDFSDDIDYRNCNFEIVDPKTGKIADGAQRQPFAKR